ncbi:MAG: ATP-binding protein [Sulfolobus sp.]|nr:ATP-binding protein [Sulfolobus sp.]
MEVEEIKRVIVDQDDALNELFSKERIINREAESYRKYLEHPNALLITGLRRSGKSILAVLLSRTKSYARVNFDDERLMGINAQELNKVLEAIYSLKGNVEVIILDEIQNVPGWELFVSRLRESKKVIVTGSNATLMSREIATYMTGRHIDLTLYPFSFSEFLEYNKIMFNGGTRTLGIVKKALEEYMTIGGIPDVIKLGQRVAEEIRRDIILKDIVLRHKIRKEKVLYEVIRFLLSNSGRELSYNRIKTSFNLGSIHTASDYVNYAEESFLVLSLEKYSTKSLSKYNLPRKIYVIDPSFMDRKEKGSLMETVVFLKLKQTISYKETSEDLYYWKDDKGEVDFVIVKGSEVKRLIQVTYAESDKDIEKREIDNLVRVGRILRCNDLNVITYDYEGREGNIKFIPLWKFLIS